MDIVLKSGESRLMQTLQKVDLQPTGWAAVHFHLSELLEEYKSEYQIKIAVNLIHDLLKNYEGGIFLLADQSIIVLCHKLERALLDKLIFQLRYLYMDDPLAYTDAGQENPEFCSSYDLRYHWRDFFELCSRCMASSGRKPFPDHKPPEPKPPPAVPEKPYPKLSIELAERNPFLRGGYFPDAAEEAPPASPARPESKTELNASTLAGIERDLAYADLHKAIRQQAVCAMTVEMKARRVFDELYIHIAHLRQMLRSEVDFLGNRWLFKYLTHILDERMLDHLRRHAGRYLAAPVSINLNVETLLSSAFDEFDAAIKPQAKTAIVIEVPVVDIFADMAAFTLARDQVQKLGYRICLDGLTTASFTSISRGKLGLDLLKVQWNAELPGDLNTPGNRVFADAVQAAGTNRVILCRCDNHNAVAFGQALGISLFQGRYIDSLLNPNAKLVN